MLSRIQKALKECNDSLHLKPRKFEALVDFLAMLPTMVDEVANPDKIIGGFIACGMIDNETKSTPDMDMILGMCKRTMTTNEYELCQNKFPDLYEYQNQHGHIPDVIFETEGFLQDRNINREIVQCDATIQQKLYQRAKCLSHQYQQNLRIKIKESLKAEALEKINYLRQKVQVILSRNKECEIKLTKAIKQDPKKAWLIFCWLNLNISNLQQHCS